VLEHANLARDVEVVGVTRQAAIIGAAVAENGPAQWRTSPIPSTLLASAEHDRQLLRLFRALSAITTAAAPLCVLVARQQ
jgi:hypothetical protein